MIHESRIMENFKKFPMPVNDVSIVFVQNVFHHALSRGFEMMSYSNENKSNSSAHMNHSTSTCLLDFFDSDFGDRNVFKGVKGYFKSNIVLLSRSIENSYQRQMLVSRIVLS